LQIFLHLFGILEKNTYLCVSNNERDMSKKTSELRSELVTKIWDFLESREITTLEAFEVSEGNAPVVAYDPSDLEDNFTLDRLVVDTEFGTITVEGSNSNSNDEWEINDISLDCIEAIADWLDEYEEEIDELCSEEDDEDEELPDEDCETIDKIKKLFNQLSSYGKVSLMCTLYYDMYDGEKDQFLRETDNG